MYKRYGVKKQRDQEAEVHSFCPVGRKPIEPDSESQENDILESSLGKQMFLANLIVYSMKRQIISKEKSPRTLSSCLLPVR